MERHFWEDWQSDSSDESVENELLINERRQYKMMPRMNLEKWDEIDFKFRFRLTKRTFAIVFSLIECKLQYNSHRSRHINPELQLLMALRFYAVGSMQVSIADFTGVSIASVCRILKKVSAAIASIAQNFIKMPSSEEEMRDVCKAFYVIASFPRCIGAIDCTHIRIQSPGGQFAENYRNRKGYFSLNIQTIAAANLKILNIIARWPGATHDQTIFNNSEIKWQLETGVYGRFLIVGDSGYKNTMYLATPLLIV